MRVYIYIYICQMRRPRVVRFDDSFHSGIQTLLIRQDGIGLHSIDIKYQDGNGISTWSEVHGCEKNLDGPSIKTTMVSPRTLQTKISQICDRFSLLKIL